ncbi:MAG TPA: methylornithine synthase PylB [Methanomassiliicoccales archaeon]|jgi:methylornithine synthase
MNTDEDLDIIISKAREGRILADGEIAYLLGLRDEASVGKLFETARHVRDRNFGHKVFLYGFVYFSTHCRNNCSFCFYRRSNEESVRYRKNREEIIGLATALEDSGIHLVDLTMGEDPTYHGKAGYNELVDLVQNVDDSVDVPIMVSPGVVPREMFTSLRNAGTDWFACYQETHNRELFSRLRPDQDYDVRLNQKTWAGERGMLTEEGIMIGVGETIADRVNSIKMMGKLGVQQVRAMTFVPQANTPMKGMPSTLMIEELVTLAVMRLVHQDKLIPASLDIEGVKGLRPRLDAGANVITSIIPPSKGLAGVAQHELDIENGERSKGNIEDMLDIIGIKIARLTDYTNFIASRKERLGIEVIQ